MSDVRALEKVDFGGLTICFDDRVLRPRPWTIAQSSWAAQLMAAAPAGPVLELCAGAGHIGLASVTVNDRHLVCVDLDPVAAAYCRDNALAAGLDDRVEVRLGRLDRVVAEDEQFPVIIADPPWVPRAETGRFPEDPLLAIDGGEDGMDVARECMAVIAEHLAVGGSAILQLGTEAQVQELAAVPGCRGRLRHVATRGFGRRGVLAHFQRD